MGVGVGHVKPCGKAVKKWRCLCVCGTLTDVATAKLNGGRTQSCGCLHKEVIRQTPKTHGMRDSREYQSWAHMKYRCHNPNYPRYALWGGRGITVCERWREDFSAFFADMGPCPAGMTIDRIDNNKGYEPGNCRWATPKEQANNLRTTRRVTFEGQEKTISEWAETWGCSRDAIKLRLKRGATFEAVAAALCPR